MTKTPVYLGIGSNINAAANIERALKLLGEAAGNLRLSPIYKNPAQGFAGDEFLNLVVSFEYFKKIPDLLLIIDAVEQSCGRRRELETGEGSRTIDLDLLIFGDLQGQHCGLQLPRPDVFNCQFVWQPLLDLFAVKDRLSDFELRIQSVIERGCRCQNLSSMEAV